MTCSAFVRIMQKIETMQIVVDSFIGGNYRNDMVAIDGSYLPKATWSRCKQNKKKKNRVVLLTYKI